MCLIETLLSVPWRRAQSASVFEASLIPSDRFCILTNDSCFTKGKVTNLFTTDELFWGSILFCGVKMDSVNAGVPV